MKYGETLRQRSIPAWSHHNIDYDDIKHFIKEHTTPGKGKIVSVPGRGDEAITQLEDNLFQILEQQHSRIDLFVKSKAGEIKRRLDHTNKQLRQLSARNTSTTDGRIPIGRLERYGKLENDVLKAGDEVRALARFIGTQRTAFRKLLKKFKKWTGSSNLEARFRDEVLDDPKSFTKLDLGSMLDEYSEMLHNIRTLYDTRMEQASSPDISSGSLPNAGKSAIDQLQTALRRGSKVEFDTAIATVPLGEEGVLANYFVHPENLVELQILLLQHMEYFNSRSRSNSGATPVSTSSPAEAFTGGQSRSPDCFIVVADDLDRYAHEQSALTVNEREHHPGLTHQKAKVAVRWNNEQNAVLSLRSGLSTFKSAPLKSKYVNAFFDSTTPFPSKTDVSFANDDKLIHSIRDEVLRNPAVRPLLRISSCRSRFNGINNSTTGFLLATLDSAISMQKPAKDTDNSMKFDFPFAVLQIRHEGTTGAELLALLDRSHLAERVYGFSLQHHGLWQIYEPKTMSRPLWIPILSQDIRKLPPPAMKAGGSVGGSGSGSQSATHRSISTPNTDGTTVVDTERSSVMPDILETPPLKSFRKKRRRRYAERGVDSNQRYWSEYDHPEDGPEGSDAYMIYLDPNAKSTLDHIVDTIGGLFQRNNPETESLSPPSPASASGDETSDEDEALLQHHRSYGTTIPHSITSSHPQHTSSRDRTHFLPPLTTICLIASIALLIVAYILATTSKHKYATEADAGIIFAIICSLLFAVIGCIPLLRWRNGTWLCVSGAVVVLILDAVFSGFLLARMLG